MQNLVFPLVSDTRLYAIIGMEKQIHRALRISRKEKQELQSSKEDTNIHKRNNEFPTNLNNCYPAASEQVGPEKVAHTLKRKL